VIRERVRVAAVNDYELIVDGLARLLSKFDDRLEVADRIVIGEPILVPVDVALYDTYGRVAMAGDALRTLAETPDVGAVAVFSMELGPHLVKLAGDAGARGFISKALAGDEIADAIVRVAKGEHVVATSTWRRPAAIDLDWPGKVDGLSERQSEVMVLVAEGLSNREIADALYLSPNTVKSYLKDIFTRMHFRNRVDATNYVRASGAFECYQPADGARRAGR
jgi:DNA-binding NarL/FixJ family response regulator